ncbi:glycosyltransferase [Mycobacterium sp. 1423905.2]|uniref:glycosyltransferase n=1 Tax=Mycobacterium sp. 1423905.2 TaxID=1856859 RepID=UPI000801A78D|nr:glycosyltransferase [Mycobacterium sp. 1423905.2]OBJ50240.1 hypothetical protein A9W95_24415 [Mycobacterium sp. 1423905.2]
MSEKASAEPPKVSVVSITYHHGAYVRDSLEGFIAQRTDFPVEIIVADDASTDNTQAIIGEYVQRHPGLFRPILREKNIGAHANVVGALSAARGEYIALCEGDDFWTDPMKLTKQVDYLDRNPQTALCFHPVRVMSDDGGADTEFPPIPWRRQLTLETLISRNFIQTNSVVYRRDSSYDDIPPKVMPMDWYLHVRHAVKGDIAMLPDTMAVYRRHTEGLWHSGYADPTKFWLTRGPGVAAMYDAMLDLVSGDPALEDAIGAGANWVFSEMAKVPGSVGDAALTESIAQHPRLGALALRQLWTQTLQRKLKKRLSSEFAGWKAHMDAYTARIKRSPSTD